MSSPSDAHSIITKKWTKLHSSTQIMNEKVTWDTTPRHWSNDANTKDQDPIHEYIEALSVESASRCTNCLINNTI